MFALHPLRVESVAWVTERRDVLSGFFFLLTVLAYVRAAVAGSIRPAFDDLAGGVRRLLRGVARIEGRRDGAAGGAADR